MGFNFEIVASYVLKRDKSEFKDGKLEMKLDEKRMLFLQKRMRKRHRKSNI